MKARITESDAISMIERCAKIFVIDSNEALDSLATTLVERSDELLHVRIEEIIDEQIASSCEFYALNLYTAFHDEHESNLNVAITESNTVIERVASIAQAVIFMAYK